MQEVVKKDNIMVYSGTYVKDRKFNKNNYSITYEGNPNGEYKLYLNLETGEVNYIDITECKNFEYENIIVNIPVVACSIHEYLTNYINLQKWFNEEKINRSREEVIEELQLGSRQKIKTYIS